MEYNFYMPAEWETHERTFIEWPVKESLVWEENFEEVKKGYTQTAKAISEFEPVTVIANEDTLEETKKMCGDFAEIIVIPHNDAWVRDNGPTFVFDKDKRLFGVNWKFNAWGEKYKPYDLDDKAAGEILSYYGVPKLDAPIVLEGGSIHVDGEGTLLTTEECLLNPNRNPSLSREEIEDVLKKFLGVSKIIWLKKGLFGDETDGHVDNAACFASPGKVVMQVCRDKKDPNYEITMENLEILKNSLDAKGRRIEVIEIEQPPARFYRGQRLTLSYLNFYFANGGIVLPIFGGDAERTDRAAVETLQKVFPERKIATVDGMLLIKEGGNVHCITQQMSKGIR